MFFDLENDLPDEIMASTSHSGSVTRNNYRVVPAPDGNSSRLRIPAEPMSSAARSSSIDQSLSTTSSSSDFFCQPAANSSMSEIISTQPVPSSSSNYLTQSQTMQCLNSVTLTQPSIIPSSFLPQSQTNQSTYSTSPSQPIAMSSSMFPPQSQTNQYMYPTSSSHSVTASTSSFLLPSQNNQSIPASTSSQSTGMSSMSFLSQSQNNLPVYSPRPAFFPSTSYLPHQLPSTPTWSPCLNPSSLSRNNNQIPYAPTAPRYYPSVNNVTSTSNSPSFLVTPGSSQYPLSLDRKKFDVKKRLLGDHIFTETVNPRHQTISTTASVQSTSSLSVPQSTSQNLQAIVAGFKKIESTVPKTTVVQDKTTSAADNITPSNKNLETNAQQNVTKEWQKQVNMELREHLVGKLIQTVFPVNAPSAAIQNLKTYMEKLEREVYENANSKCEYYLLLAEKSYKIQKEINKKLQERKELQLQQQQQQQPQQQLQSQQSENLLQDVEMCQSESAVGSGKNNSDNQLPNTTPGASHTLSLANNLPTNNQKNVTKEWHKQIGAELRKILVKEFVQKMLPVSSSEAVINNSEESLSTIDDRIKSYAKSVECDIYQKADSRIEYYDLLADKYCKMQEELQKGNFAALENS